MTMHLVRGMSTTNTKKRKAKNKTQSQLAAEQEHKEFLRRMGIGNNSNKKKNTYKPEKFESRVNHIPSVDSEFAACTQRKENVYTGEREYLGAFTMHKSNMVPVFGDRKKDAEEIAKMRR